VLKKLHAKFQLRGGIMLRKRYSFFCNNEDGISKLTDAFEALYISKPFSFIDLKKDISDGHTRLNLEYHKLHRKLDKRIYEESNYSGLFFCQGSMEKELELFAILNYCLDKQGYYSCCQENAIYEECSPSHLLSAYNKLITVVNEYNRLKAIYKHFFSNEADEKSIRRYEKQACVFKAKIEEIADIAWKEYQYNLEEQNGVEKIVRSFAYLFDKKEINYAYPNYPNHIAFCTYYDSERECEINSENFIADISQGTVFPFSGPCYCINEQEEQVKMAIEMLKRKNVTYLSKAMACNVNDHQRRQFFYDRYYNSYVPLRNSSLRNEYLQKPSTGAATEKQAEQPYDNNFTFKM
jgi:signal recognition particle subunit SEC65